MNKITKRRKDFKLKSDMVSFAFSKEQTDYSVENRLEGVTPEVGSLGGRSGLEQSLHPPHSHTGCSLIVEGVPS